ncbi:MAG TPA: GNAT family protein [Streptosporangiaceae bacterium]
MALKTTFADKPTLTGELVLLRPVQASDAAGLLAVDAETLRLTGSPQDTGFTLEKLEDWYATRAEHDDRLDLSIIERATGEWAGEVVLNELSQANESCGFRILLQGPRFYGRGLGTEATRLVVDYAFTVAGVHRIELEVYDFNPRARHVYEKVGFTHEGTKRDALRWDGEWVDCHCLGLLQREWRTWRSPPLIDNCLPR